MRRWEQVASESPFRRIVGAGTTLAPPEARPDVGFSVHKSPRLNDAAEMGEMVIGPPGVADDMRADRVDQAARFFPLSATDPPARSLGTVLRVVDLAALAVGFVLVGYELPGATTLEGRFGPGVVAAIVTAAVMRPLGLYRSRCCSNPGALLSRLMVAAAVGGGAFAVAALRFGRPPPWHAVVCAAAALTTTLMGRWQYGRFLRARRAEGHYLRRVLLVGSNADSADLRTIFRSEPELGYTVAGVVAGDSVHPSLTDLPVAGSVADIPELASETGASGIFLVPYALSSGAAEAAVSAACDAGLHVQIWPGLRGVGTPRLRAVPMSGEPFFYVEARRAARWQLLVKRVIDVVGAVLCLLCTAPILGIAALLVKLDGGPVFYRGERVGLHGRIIVPLKLRTMAETHDLAPTALQKLNQRSDGPLFKSSSDPRVTAIGRFLRASSIDELPQLWNVLRGTMSLVGPRPALPEEAAQFDPVLQRRSTMRPGMTGLWQVEARLNRSFNAYRRLDLRYVDNWSIRLDLSILLATIPAVVSQAFRLIRDRRKCP